MFYLESYNGSYNIVISYDATIENPSCIDEDGNIYDGTNGKFQYAPWNGGNPNTWTDLPAGQTTKPAAIVALRFVNTNNNKPFICCAKSSDWTGNDVSTEIPVSQCPVAKTYLQEIIKPLDKCQIIEYDKPRHKWYQTVDLHVNEYVF